MERRRVSKVAIVTGAGRGIGAAIARELAQRGVSVAINYTADHASAEATRAAVADAGGTAILVQGDVRDLSDLERIFSTVKDRWGRLDILVNNAGISGSAMLEAIEASLIERTISVHLTGTLLASRLAAASFGEEGGVIVNLSSSLANQPMPAQAVYAAAKAGIEAATRVLAQELGRRRIRVNAVAPGAVETDLIRDGLNEDVNGYICSRTPLGRVGQPEDIAKVVAFLASDDAGWITGQVITADGGLRI
jgi:3-oxoacyl-[acyl-carrier protein] reductase